MKINISTGQVFSFANTITITTGTQNKNHKFLFIYNS